jgi:hypothetical protein
MKRVTRGRAVSDNITTIFSMVSGGGLDWYSAIRASTIPDRSILSSRPFHDPNHCFRRCANVLIRIGRSSGRQPDIRVQHAVWVGLSQRPLQPGTTNLAFAIIVAQERFDDERDTNVIHVCQHARCPFWIAFTVSSHAAKIA